MILITPGIRKKLELRGKKQYPPLEPVVKIFNPFGAESWWICYIKIGEAYGFADLGLGVDFGPIDLAALENIRFRVSAAGRSAAVGLERELDWDPKTGWDPEQCRPIP